MSNEPTTFVASEFQNSVSHDRPVRLSSLVRHETRDGGFEHPRGVPRQPAVASRLEDLDFAHARSPILVVVMTSFLTLVTTSASLQRNSAGMTSDDVLPTCVGPTMSSELRDARRTRGP